MVRFSKIFGLAATAMTFAGMAFGQFSCSGLNVVNGTVFLRAEGTTEVLPQITFQCTNATAGTPVTLQVFVSPVASITSKVLSGTTTEAQATIGLGGQNPIVANGIASGNTVSFSITPTAANFTVNISNIRVNATQIPSGSGLPQPIQEQVFASSGGTNPNTVNTAGGGTAVNVAFVQPGLAVSKIANAFNSTTAPSSPVVCSLIGNSTSSARFVVSVTEGFQGAFRTQTQENQLLVTPTSTNSTRVKLTFNNVPSNVTLYVPLTATGAPSGSTTPAAGDTGTLALLTGETAAEGSLASAGASGTAPTFTLNGNTVNTAAVTTSGGTGTAVYETAARTATAIDTFQIPVFVSAAANTVTATNTALNVSVSLAPVGSSTNFPSFSVGANTSNINVITFNLCTTSLLFPFVTNQSGFDTGIAIANTSTDPFGSGRGAVPQSGTCSMSFFGNNAPTASVTTANVPSGTVFTQVLSGIAPGFQGYAIAQCNFQFAHGFAFLTDGVGANGGLSEGYLAGVIPDTNQTPRAASPLSAASSGTGETLGN
jgi:hypothetical protein